MPAFRSSSLALVGLALMVVGVVLLAAQALDGGSSGGASDGGIERDPAVTAAPATTSSTFDAGPRPGLEPEGFTTVTARITDADGEVCDVCVWLADTVDERGRGLMGVTDLGDAVGMVFSFEELVVNSFFMRDTPTPLSIAWFDPFQGYVASTDMAPCLEVPEEGCPLYSPGVAYQFALEVFEGDLGALGVGPGSRLELLPGTESPTCLA